MFDELHSVIGHRICRSDVDTHNAATLQHLFTNLHLLIKKKNVYFCVQIEYCDSDDSH